LLGDGTIQGIPTKAAATCFKVIAIQKEPPISIDKVFSITVSQSGAGHGGAAVTDPPADAKDNSKSADTSKQTGSTPNAPVDCSAVSADKPCTFTHTVHSLDREWWDVSLAVAI